jgi:hypothetical protein
MYYYLYINENPTIFVLASPAPRFGQIRSQLPTAKLFDNTMSIRAAHGALIQTELL